MFLGIESIFFDELIINIISYDWRAFIVTIALVMYVQI